MLQCVWNNVRSIVRAPTQEPPAVAVKEEEQDNVNEPVNRPEFFTGELPQNTIVDISALNRPDQAVFIEAVNQPPVGYEEDPGFKKVMPHKSPFAFEWPENSGWNAQQRPTQRISLENNKNPKIWDTPPGAAAKTLASEIQKLNATKWRRSRLRIYILALQKRLKESSPRRR